MDDPVATLIAKWPKPSLANFARDLGVRVEHAGSMKHRKSIPSTHWLAVVRAAEGRGIEGVTLEMLAEMAAARRDHAA